MAYPAYESSGSLGYAYTTTTLSVPYPATVSADDILIAIVVHYGSNAITWNTPANWTKLYDVQGGGSLAKQHAFYWKRAAGTESGSEDFTHSYMANNYNFGVMHRFSGCIASGTPWDDIGTSNGDGTTVSIAAQTASGTERLAVSFMGQMRLTGVNDDATSYSRSAQPSTTSGIDAVFPVFTYQQASAGATPADSYTKSAGGGAYNEYAEMTVVFKPVAATGYGHKVMGVASANIGKVNGVATANISEVLGV